jgi:ribokinase
VKTCFGAQVLPGGKGANQAVAAGRLAPRLGCDVQFCGVFGSDVHAPMLRATMLAAGVDLSLCFESQGPTGQAVILLQPGGENSIVLVPAANADW